MATFPSCPRSGPPCSVTAPEPEAPPRGSALTRAGWAIVVTVLLLAVLEGALRLYTTREGVLLTWERPDGAVMLDATTGAVTLRPGARESTADGRYDWSARINTQGLRMDATVPEERPAGEQRWLLLGDSWAYGVATRQTAGLATRLGAALSTDMTRGHVVNAGVPGASAWDVLQRWRTLRDRFAVDGVVVKVPVNFGSEASRARAREAALRGLPPDLRILLALRRAVLLLQSDELRVETPAAATEAEASLRAIAEEARARALPVAVLVAPVDAAASQDVSRTSAQLARWRRVLEGTGALVVAHALNQRSCFGWEDRSHPSESGAEVLAQALAGAIRAGRSADSPATAPSCDDVDAVGPGKPQRFLPDYAGGATRGSSSSTPSTR